MPVRRQVAVLALVGYTVVLVGVLLTPTSTPGSTAVEVVASALAALGVPAWVSDSGAVEFALNVVIFAPWTALAATVWRRTRWQSWTAYGFLATAAVECFQALALGDSRSATLSDVVANTLGALLGAGAVSAARAWRAAHAAV